MIRKLSTTHSGSIYSVAFSLDGEKLVSGSDDNIVYLWNAVTGQKIHRLEGHSGSVRSVAFSPDSKKIVSGSIDGTVYIWNVVTGKHTQKLEGHSGWVSTVAFAPDGKQVVSGSDDKTVRIWNIASEKQPQKVIGHSHWVQSVAFSPDGKQIVSGSTDRSVAIWNVASGKQVKRLEGHSGWVRYVAFSPNGTQVVSGSDDQTVCIWNVATGYQIQKLKGHSGCVRSVAFSPDGKQVVSGSDDQTVCIWDLDLHSSLHSSHGSPSRLYSPLSIKSDLRFYCRTSRQFQHHWVLGTFVVRLVAGLMVDKFDLGLGSLALLLFECETKHHRNVFQSLKPEIQLRPVNEGNENIPVGSRNFLGYHSSSQREEQVRNFKKAEAYWLDKRRKSWSSDEGIKRCLRNLAASRCAAVLVALFVGRPGNLSLCRRASTLRSFAGDTSLPGGKMDPEDKTIEDTARREAFEEIGLPLDPSKAPLLCMLEPFYVEKQLLVTPVVVLILDNTLQPILNSTEVTALFSHPLASFLSCTPPASIIHSEPELVELGGDGYRYHHSNDWDWDGPPVLVPEITTAKFGRQKMRARKKLDVRPIQAETASSSSAVIFLESARSVCIDS
ncbi:WD40 repeat-like protein [Gymnopus androsaceus JB14]|uniref:WD40 repeat-like protein n=1 Tax=Gymnopus androsaceus JB14 TaxID=1447944 RepID=A0A6A4GPM9_9AGAR|nr:WD40 repeat-like protein [Gymnopus androsaceus JB14]